MKQLEAVASHSNAPTFGMSCFSHLSDWVYGAAGDQAVNGVNAFSVSSTEIVAYCCVQTLGYLKTRANVWLHSNQRKHLHNGVLIKL